jgi:hypothetical protein
MNSAEFIKTVQKSGYGSERDAKEYVQNHPKSDYDTDDIIQMHQVYDNMKWPAQDIKGMRSYVYGVNGRTTAMSNGIMGNSNGSQDWN